MKRSVWGGVTPKITRAAGAVVLGLALTATPVFAIAAEQPAAKTEAATTAAATEQAATTAAAAPVADNGAANAAVQPTATQGKAVTVKHDWQRLLWWNKEECLSEMLDDQSVTDITLGVEGEWNPSNGIKEVTVDRDLTIHGFAGTAGQTGHNNNFINDIVFTVTPGHTLTLDNVNIYTDPAGDGHTEASAYALLEARTVIDVKSQAKLVTTGTGDIISNNGNGDAIAINIEDGGSAELGAAPSGFQWDNDHAGTYGSTAAVRAGFGSTLKITNGRFTEENGDGAAIVSSGKVIIDPVEDAGFWAPSDSLGGNLGTVQVRNSTGELVAKHTQFGLNEQPSGEQRENANVKAALSVTGGAKAYLTDCYASSTPVATNSGDSTVSAIYVDGDAASAVYTQDNTWEDDLQTLSTENDQPGFGGFKSAYEGDHLTKNQYYAEATNESVGNTVDGTTQLFKIDDGQEFSDLKSQLAAKATDLKAEVTPNDDGVTANVKAPLALGKSNVYGKYEIAKNPDTGITGEGHVYEISAVHNLQAGWDVSAFRSDGNLTAPAAGTENAGVAGETVPAGTVFAGWYTQGGDLRTGTADNDYVSDVLPKDLQIKDGAADQAALKANETTGYAYAKFVPAELMNLKSEGPLKKPAAGQTWIARFMIAKDSYNYNGTTFKIEELDKNGNATGRKATINTLNNWDYVTAEGKKTYAKDVFQTDIPLLWNRVYLEGIKADFDGSFKVTPSWTTMDGTVVTGQPEVISAANLLKDAE